MKTGITFLTSKRYGLMAKQRKYLAIFFSKSPLLLLLYPMMELAFVFHLVSFVE